MQAFFGDPGQNVDPEASAEILESDSACLTDAPTSPNGPNADLIARLQAAEAKVADLERALGCEQRVLVAEAEAHLKALSREAEAVKRIAELEEQVADQVSTIKDNILTITRLAREAGEAKGKLEMSEAAGVVEG
jgi:uncharacterized coiled-coil protein SlyX